ncbi:MAG: hypothetical protein WDM77_05860 [Steroidobacteraceae bacterium]
MRNAILMLVATVALAGTLTAKAAGAPTSTLLPSQPADSGQSYVWARRTLQHFSHPVVLTSETDGWHAESCEQLYKSVKILLVELGARESDLDVDQRPCYTFTTLRTVDVSFSVVAPEEKAGKGSAATLSSARWQRVAMKGDCNYLQYVTRAILPLFTTRDVKLITPADCAKIGVGLYAQVLMTTPEPAASP